MGNLWQRFGFGMVYADEEQKCDDKPGLVQLFAQSGEEAELVYDFDCCPLILRNWQQSADPRHRHQWVCHGAAAQGSCTPHSQ
eukprot:5932289-Amphidinium_carterae.1